MNSLSIYYAFTYCNFIILVIRGKERILSAFRLPDATLSLNASYSTGNSPSRIPLVLSDFKEGFASMAPMVQGSPYKIGILIIFVGVIDGVIL